MQGEHEARDVIGGGSTAGLGEASTGTTSSTGSASATAEPAVALDGDSLSMTRGTNVATAAPSGETVTHGGTGDRSASDEPHRSQPHGPEGTRREDIERALLGSPVMLFGVDADLRYSWMTNVHSPWSEELLLGRTDGEVLGGERGDEIMAAKRRVLESGRAETIEFDVTFERQRYWYEVSMRRDDTGGAPRLLCTALDISEKKRREIMLQALLREVSHRSKNLLSMVLSIASQTSRKASDQRTFLSRFTGRIQSIARSQDAITHSDWRGASLSELFASQVLVLLPGRESAARRAGTDLHLTPNAALHVGLALHELATNAINHGALRRSDGRVLLTVHPVEDGRGARLEWRETGAPAFDAGPGSFGMTTLKRIVPAAVSGAATLTGDEGGFVYTLEIDASQCETI